MKAIGIFGGTFAPPHNGHIAAANAFLSQCALDRLFIVPTSIPPHKRVDFADDPHERLCMLEAAFEDDARYNRAGGIFISDFEATRDGKSYTVNTLKFFKEQYGAPLIFLCGADMFVTLDKWYHAEEIFRLAAIAYAGRAGIPTGEKAEEFVRDYGATLYPLDMPPYALSSTEIRKKISEGADVSGALPAKVLDYIKRKRLYSTAD